MSLTLLWLTVVLGGVLAGMAISGPLPLAPMSARLVQCGVAMLAAQCLCLSFLFQARHAIYVTVEPPAERAAWFVALWRRYREAAKETLALPNQPCEIGLGGSRGAGPACKTIATEQWLGRCSPERGGGTDHRTCTKSRSERQTGSLASNDRCDDPPDPQSGPSLTPFVRGSVEKAGLRSPRNAGNVESDPQSGRIVVDAVETSPPECCLN